MNRRQLIVVSIFVADLSNGCYSTPTPASPVPSSPFRKRSDTRPPELTTTGSWETLNAKALVSFLGMEKKLRATSSYMPVANAPNGVASSARAGRDFPLGYRNAAWMLDDDSGSMYRLWVDSNGDGDFTDESPALLERVGTDWEAIASANPEWRGVIRIRGETAERTTTELVVEVLATRSKVQIRSDNIRRGSVDLDSKHVQFAIVGVGGYYGLGPAKFYYDVNMDGVIDTSRESSEWVYNRDRFITVGKRSFAFNMNLSGATVYFVETGAVRTQPRLHPTAKLPTVDLTLTTGERVLTSSFRGRYLLLDFFSYHCAPCVRDLPRLAMLLKAHDSVSAVSLTEDDNDIFLTEFLSRAQVNWPVAVESQHRRSLFSVFAVDSVPRYVFVDKSGTILCHDCSLEEIEGLVSP